MAVGDNSSSSSYFFLFLPPLFLFLFLALRPSLLASVFLFPLSPPFCDVVSSPLWTASNSIKAVFTPHTHTYTTSVAHSCGHTPSRTDSHWKTPPLTSHSHTQVLSPSIIPSSYHLPIHSEATLRAPPPPPLSPFLLLPPWNTLRRPVACERRPGLGEEKHNYFSPRLFTQR